MRWSWHSNRLKITWLLKFIKLQFYNSKSGTLPACLLEIFAEVIRPCYPCFWKTIAIVRPTEIPQFSPNICSSVDCRIHTIHICNQANNINKFEAQTPYHRKWFASRASLDSLSVLVWCILTMGQKRFS